MESTTWEQCPKDRFIPVSVGAVPRIEFDSISIIEAVGGSNDELDGHCIACMTSYETVVNRV